MICPIGGQRPCTPRTVVIRALPLNTLDIPHTSSRADELAHCGQDGRYPRTPPSSFAQSVTRSPRTDCRLRQVRKLRQSHREHQYCCPVVLPPTSLLSHQTQLGHCIIFSAFLNLILLVPGDHSGTVRRPSRRRAKNFSCRASLPPGPS